MNFEITDETLVRYVDNELSPEECVAFEAALNTDSNLSKQVALLRGSDQTLRRFSAYSDRQSLPPVKLVPMTVTTTNRGAVWPMALAASLVAAAIGLGVGRYWLPHNITDVSVSETGDGLSQMRSVVFAALEKSPQGEGVTWTNPDKGETGTATIRKTWQLDDGTWCREYEYVVRDTDENSSPVYEAGAACRDDNGDWQVRLRVYPSGGDVLKKLTTPTKT